MSINELNLDGKWKIKYSEPSEGEREGYFNLCNYSEGWIDAQVPGMVHTVLENNGMIDSIYYGDNANMCTWIEEKEWWYKKCFYIENILEDCKLILEFDGLDSIGKIWINGTEIGCFNNMYKSFRYDVTHMLKNGENNICVKFDPIDDILRRQERNTDLEKSSCFNGERIYFRKMQCGFGWDWAPKLITCGIWRGVKLLFRKAEIVSTFIRTDWLNEDKSRNTIEVQYEEYVACKDLTLNMEITFDNKTVYRYDTSLKSGQGKLVHNFEVKDPKLWWPNGIGPQNLYGARIIINDGSNILDEKEFVFGIRTVEHKLSDGKESCFKFLINGKEIFVKGANWVPADSLPSAIGREKYYTLLKLAADAHFNMLRVWGGGIYEDECFYEFCNKLGIMVWQEFMFSCAFYPENEEFVKMVEEEAGYVVKTLRNHPAIVLWCGNNEVGMNDTPDADFSGKVIFDRILKDICMKLDGSRPYRPSSPYGDGVKTSLINNSPETGDWHGGSWFEFFKNKDIIDIRDIIGMENSNFIAEFPIEGAPPEESLKEFMPDYGKWPFEKYHWEYHTKNSLYTGFDNTLFEIMLENSNRIFGNCSNYSELVLKTALAQGVFLKEEIEHYRRNKGKCWGAMFWMYNDCWPAVSWSIVDYYTRPKAAYYFAKAAYSPALLSFRKIGRNAVSIYVINDTFDELKLSFKLYLATTEGEIEFEKHIPVLNIPMNTSICVATEEFNMKGNINKYLLYGRLYKENVLISENVHLFADRFADIFFPDKIRIKTNLIKSDENKYRLDLETDKYAGFAVIKSNTCEIRPDDNYFHLLPFIKKSIMIESSKPFEKGDLNILTLPNSDINIMENIE